ncbi:MAG TPA: hypothetical protein VKA53_08715 [Thermoanaerobaculia bacterium]|nr:hypothetical protein [Thermoanaerobaculia bacterium]
MFAAAEELAKELGVSRSQLYSEAMAELIARKQASGVTQRLNEVYSEVEAGLPRDLETLQYLSLEPDEW